MDDERQQLHDFEELLRKRLPEGFEIVQAVNVEEAVAQLNGVGLVVTDYWLRAIFCRRSFRYSGE